MPIYEFYCKECHTIYKFFSRVINTEKVPTCPECQHGELERRVSTFAMISGEKETSDDLPIDEAQLEKAMMMLAKEADGLDEDDPRQAAALMRKLSDATGLNMGPRMEEAIQRLEQGEDPEKIEEEMGDLLEDEDLFTLAKKIRSESSKTPRVEETIYDL
ncbi:MAG: zinc ribbon domain-containing protein [bacterium]